MPASTALVKLETEMSAELRSRSATDMNAMRATMVGAVESLQTAQLDQLGATLLGPIVNIAETIRKGKC